MTDATGTPMSPLMGMCQVRTHYPPRTSRLMHKKPNVQSAPKHWCFHDENLPQLGRSSLVSLACYGVFGGGTMASLRGSG